MGWNEFWRGVGDWFKKKGEEFMDHHSNTVNGSDITSTRGWYNVEQDLAGNGQPMNDTKQENMDNRNIREAGMTFNDLMQRYVNGEIDALELQRLVGEHNIFMNPMQEAWLNNIIAQQNTQSDRDFQTEQRDTSLISTYDQLLKLGMNPGSVVQVGGANSGVSSVAAPTMKTDIANQRFNRQTQMAKTMIGLAGGLASTGVHGAALGAARFAASKLTSEASKYATDMKYGGVKTSYYDPENRSSHTFYTY